MPRIKQFLLSRRMASLVAISVCLFLCQVVTAQQSPAVDNGYGAGYEIKGVNDYSFNELLSQGITTVGQKLKIWNVPVGLLSPQIRCFVRMHNFEICGFCHSKEKRFRAVKFTYPSVAPNGDSVALSGLAVFPIVDGNSLARMMIYNDFVAAGKGFAPTASMPIQSVVAADNTLCVFPDCYGYGSTSDKDHPFLFFQYHARCVAECALAALDVVSDMGITLDTGFYSWNTGYSIGGNATSKPLCPKTSSIV